MSATPLTPNSSLTAYAQVSDLISYRDWRQLADWTSDTDSRPTEQSLYTNPIVLQALQSSSGEVESICTQAELYLPVDLQALTGVSQQLLIEIVCQLTIAKLCARRSRDIDPEMFPGTIWAREKLMQISQGIAIFGFQESQESGAPSNASNYANQWQRPSLQYGELFGYRNRWGVGGYGYWCG